MQKLLLSLPDDLAEKFRAAVPARTRSKLVAELIRKEVIRREQQLYNAALQVEQDQALNKEMEDWDITTNDGLENDSEDESW